MKRGFMVALMAIAMVGCSKEEATTEELVEATLDANGLIGTWIMDSVDGEKVVTNECFAVQYDGSLQNYSGWSDLDGDNSDWLYKESVPYSIIGNIIKIDYDNDYLELDAVLNGDYVSWFDNAYIEDGEDKYTGRTFSGYRSSVDYTEDITTGIWEGNATDGRDSNPYLRIKYYSDGTYDFQYRNTLEEDWSAKADNEGKYYIIGEYFGSVWVNDINSDVAGKMSEAWMVEITDDTMIWTATRADDAVESFEYTRVEE